MIDVQGTRIHSLPPALLRDFPATYITSFHLPAARNDVVNGLVARFPNVTAIDVGPVLAQIQRVLEQVIYKWTHSREIITRVLRHKYADLVEAGWQVSEEEIRRDTQQLLGGAFWDFVDAKV